jgi:hypothetical protein
MKAKGFLLVSLLGIVPAFAVNRTTPANARVEVVFFEPEKYTDVRDSFNSDDPTRTGYLDQLRDYIVQQARYYVPEGQKLYVTFTDIDMAGDFEPWRGPRFDDVRIIKDIYPPRINLSFRLVDAEGNIIKQGQRELKDLAFQMRITSAFQDDPLRYEKSLLDDWMREDLPRVKK